MINVQLANKEPTMRFAPLMLLLALPVAVLAQASDDAQILPGRPDEEKPAPTTARSHAPGELGERFDSASAGISFQPPAGGKAVRRANNPEFVRFISEDGKWSITANRSTLQDPMPLTTTVSDEGKRVGMLELTQDNLRRANPRLQVIKSELRSDLPVQAGLLVVRYTQAAETVFHQQAIIKADERLYYTLTYITPGARDGGSNVAPEERDALITFQAVLKSVSLMDRTHIKQDQDERLIRTMALFVNLTPERIEPMLKDEQWLRIIENAKDVGYTYIIEESEQRASRRGVKVGMRTRRMVANRQIDTASWLYTTIDRRNETFSSVRVVTEGDKETHVTEIGSADRFARTVAVHGQGFGQKPSAELAEQHTLNVKTMGKSLDIPAVERDLPPFYLPQAMRHLLPRLIPLADRKTYLFATYVSDAREVMLHYVDVLKRDREVDLGDGVFRATVVEERSGQEGAVTAHYFDEDGAYRGSESSIERDGKRILVTLLPTDADTLKRMWKAADLSRPDELEEADPSKEQPAATDNVRGKKNRRRQ